MTKVNNHNLEVRVQETRMTSEGDMLVSGYVNMTNQLSYELGHIDKFVEKIAPGAFTRAINKASNNGNDIDFLAEHDDTLVLASTKNNTLKLSEDDTGLFMEARIINTSSGRDYYEMIQSGIITNMSFGFYAVDDDWKSVRSDLYERTINELELFEVSAVRRPAYAASTISNRGLNISDETVPENIKEEIGMAEENNNVEQDTTEAEVRSTEELLQDVLVELTQEVRELRTAMSEMKEERKFVAKKKDDEEDEDKKDKKDDKKEDDKDVKKDEDVKEDDKKDEDKKDVKKDDVDDAKDDKKELDKDGKPVKKDDEDDEDDEDKKKKKKDNRSYSLFREEFEQLRGGNK